MYRTSFLEKGFLCLNENYGSFFYSLASKSEILIMFSNPEMAKDSGLIDLHQYTVYMLISYHAFPRKSSN
jgi:hypothetical protein